MPDSWLCIARIRRWKRRSKQILQEDAQTVSLFSLLFRSQSNKSASRWGERGCISCRAAPRNGGTVMCQLCHHKASRMAPVIIEVPEDHENYKSGASSILLSFAMEADRYVVESQFIQSWRHGTICPEVRAVYKIVHPPASMKRYEQYL